MNTDSINKVNLIGLNLIDPEAANQIPYLTTNTTGNLPFMLKTRDSALFSTTNITVANDPYYMMMGIRENPKLTGASNVTTVTSRDAATYNWKAGSSWQVRSSSTATGSNKWNVFDKSDSTAWSSAELFNSEGAHIGVLQSNGNTRRIEAIRLDYPENITMRSFSITCGSSVNEAPKDFIFYGYSATTRRWKPLYRATNITWTANEIKTFSILDSAIITDSRIFQLNVSKTNGGTKLTIAELKHFSDYTGSTWTTTMPANNLESINFTALLTGTTNPILILLNNLRVCYNLLNDPVKFAAYNTTTGTTIHKYSMSSMGTYDSVNIKSSDTTNPVKAVFGTAVLDKAKTSFLAVKRLIKAYEYIIHVYIAMTIESSSDELNSTPITDLILNRLNYINNALNDNLNGYKEIQNQLTTATDIYNSRIDTIDNLDIQLEDLKEDVSKEKQQKTTNSNILNKNTIVYYVFLLLFIILASVLLYVLQNKDDEKSKLYVGGVIVSSIVAMIIIYFLNTNYLKEGFTTYQVTSTNLQNYINKYLSDTLNISLMADKYTLYSGDLLHIVSKEIDRYEVINHQLKLEAAGTKDVQVYDYRSARVLQYRVYLFLQIILILSIAMFIYLYTGENIILFGITLLLVLLMIYIYIMNSHSMVHTDATKIYWGQPSMI